MIAAVLVFSDHVAKVLQIISAQGEKREERISTWLETRATERDMRLAQHVADMTEIEETRSVNIDTKVTDLAKETERLGSALTEFKQETTQQFDRLASLLESLRKE